MLAHFKRKRERENAKDLLFLFLRSVLFRGLDKVFGQMIICFKFIIISSTDKDDKKFEELKFNNGANEIALIMRNGFKGISRGLVVLRC